MPASRTLPAPSTVDPLAHPTLGMRLHAAYLAAGYTRAQFVAALRAANPELKTRYGTVMAWESGAVPDLFALATAAQLVEYTMDQLFHGHNGHSHPRRASMFERPATGVARPPEPKLTDEAITALLDQVGATDEQRAALGEYRQSPAGHFAAYTRTFVVEFVRLYSAALLRRRAHPQALIEAARGARSKRVTAQTIALGGKPMPLTELKKIGAETAAIERKSRVKRKR